jgi:TRAP-type C4-dicarboxylate transport system substrate-binding protein
MKNMLAAGAALLAIGLPAAMAEPVELTISNFLPAVSPMNTDMLQPWAKSVEECAPGEVSFNLVVKGSQLGNITRQHEQVLSGVVDVAHGLHGIPRGRFPRTSLIDIPFVAGSSKIASLALWDIFDEYLASEYEGMKVLALHAHNPGHIHTIDTRIEKLEDLAGLRIRAPSPATAMMLETLGATPVGLPGSQAYENLQQGVIDGTVFPWEAIGAFRLDEVINYHLDAGLYTVSFWFAMNEDVYNGLPENVRACVDQYSGEALISEIGEKWSKWDQPGLERIAERGSTVTALSGDERARWKEALEPMVDAYIKSVEEAGVDNAQQIYQALLDAVARREGEGVNQ